MTRSLRAGAVLALAVALGAGRAHAVPSVPATPSPDVYAVLAQNPGLAASVPLYTAPQEPGRFTSLTVIGDSYGDWGNALAFNPASSQVGADGRYGNALNIVDALQYHYGLPTGSVTNYAFGGATTGTANNNPPALQLPGFAQEMAALVASGRTFGASDLISFTTAGVGGGNDTPVGIGVPQGVSNVVGYVSTLVGLGAKTILLTGPATAELRTALAPFAAAGTSIDLVDTADLTARILADPAAHGFAADATGADYCARFGGAHVCNEGGINKARVQSTAEILAEDRYLYFYAHPTTAFAAQIAQADIDALAVPEPATAGLLAAGLLGAAALTRRRAQPPR